MKARCAHCSTKLDIPDEYTGTQVKCPQCGQSFVANPEGIKPLDTAGKNSIPEKNRNWLVRYKDHCGRRSFIFQCILLGWTAFMAFVSLSLLMSSLPHENDEAEIAAWGAVGLCCPIGTWLLLSVPLGILAIACLRSEDGDTGAQ